VETLRIVKQFLTVTCEASYICTLKTEH